MFWSMYVHKQGGTECHLFLDNVYGDGSCSWPVMLLDSATLSFKILNFLFQSNYRWNTWIKSNLWWSVCISLVVCSVVLLFWSWLERFNISQFKQTNHLYKQVEHTEVLAVQSELILIAVWQGGHHGQPAQQSCVWSSFETEMFIVDLGFQVDSA